MIIRSDQANGFCDDYPNGKPCRREATCAAVARGATGRWCEVLWLCPECAAREAGGADNIMTAAAARAKIEAMNADVNYPDF